RFRLGGIVVEKHHAGCQTVLRAACRVFGKQADEAYRRARDLMQEDQNDRPAVGRGDEIELFAGVLDVHAANRKPRQRFSRLRTGEDRRLFNARSLLRPHEAASEQHRGNQHPHPHDASSRPRT
ncbi:MAG: hypothetical protein KDA21_06720, partial [Phycisphaerales bacterium]|nr:hypothetical protein [Phycisphaerales bacterium]